MSSPSGAGPTVILVAADSADLDLLAGWMRDLRRDDPMPAETLADESAARRAMADVLADEKIGRVWLIRHAQSLVGYAVLMFIHSIEFGGRCAFLDEIYVAADHRGGGIGKAALALIEAQAIAADARMMLLEASPENERANRLYRSAGFAPRKYRLLTKRLGASHR